MVYKKDALPIGVIGLAMGVMISPIWAIWDNRVTISWHDVLGLLLIYIDRAVADQGFGVLVVRDRRSGGSRRRRSPILVLRVLLPGVICIAYIPHAILYCVQPAPSGLMNQRAYV